MTNRGLLIVNLGSPEKPAVDKVKPFLTEFLMDKEVIDKPWIFRFFLVRGIIIPARLKNSTEAYKSIFTERGSPLKFHTEDFIQAIKGHLSSSFKRIDFAMRYGSPSIESRVKEFIDAGVAELIVVPMYPQFAKSSTRTVLNELKHTLLKHKNSKLEVKVQRDFFDENAYVNSFAHIINEEAKAFRPDHLLLSYHGLPEDHVKQFAPNVCFQNSDCCARITEENKLCYRAQCFASSRAIIKALNPDFQVSVSFQSRLGRKEWIKPYTDKEIEKLVESGVRRLLVACPAFVADCLETLEEIAIRLKEDFIKLGGGDLRLVPSLNAHPYWVKSFGDMVLDKAPSLKALDQVLKEIT